MPDSVEVRAQAFVDRVLEVQRAHGLESNVSDHERMVAVAKVSAASRPLFGKTMVGLKRQRWPF